MKTNAELTKLGQVLFDAGVKSERQRIEKIIDDMKWIDEKHKSEIEERIFGYNEALESLKSKLNEVS